MQSHAEPNEKRTLQRGQLHPRLMFDLFLTNYSIFWKLADKKSKVMTTIFHLFINIYPFFLSRSTTSGHWSNGLVGSRSSFCNRFMSEVREQHFFTAFLCPFHSVLPTPPITHTHSTLIVMHIQIKASICQRVCILWQAVTTWILKQEPAFYCFFRVVTNTWCISKSTDQLCVNTVYAWQKGECLLTAASPELLCLSSPIYIWAWPVRPNTLLLWLGRTKRSVKATQKALSFKGIYKNS